MKWIALIGILVILLVGCSQGTDEPADIDNDTPEIPDGTPEPPLPPVMPENESEPVLNLTAPDFILNTTESNDSSERQTLCENGWVIHQITTDENFQGNPAVYGNRIIWEDDRHQENPKHDIYMYDLATQEETRITRETARTPWGPSMQPKIVEDKIVFVDYRHGDEEDIGMGSIYLYDIINREKSLLVDRFSQGYSNLGFSGRYLVWHQDIGDTWDDEVYMYDLYEDVKERVTKESTGQFPSIYGDLIVFSNASSHAGLFLYNIRTKETEPLLSDDKLSYNLPYMHGDKIVVMGQDLLLYTISTQEVKVLTTKTVSNFKVHQNYVVWTMKTTSINKDLFLYDLDTDTEYQLTVNKYNQDFADIQGNKIVWEDHRGRTAGFINADIYMAELPLQPCEP